MILDSSAIVAIMLREPGHAMLSARIADAPFVAVGAPTLLEATIVLSARLDEDARPLLARLLAEASIEVLAVSEAHVQVATDAWLRFGRGRHPAALTFGDCLAYASAVVADAPLLCVGDDFGKTDCLLA